MERRLELQRLLEEILGSSNVYFQPSPSFRMQYPAIVYKRNDVAVKRANNNVYTEATEYLVTHISRDPDSEVISKLAHLPMCEYDRPYVGDNLYHDVFRLYY